jgi:predicted nucleotidyltransferase
MMLLGRQMSADIAIAADEGIACLRAHAAELRAAGIRHLSLFGSVARGDAGPESGIDLGNRLHAV